MASAIFSLAGAIHGSFEGFITCARKKQKVEARKDLQQDPLVDRNISPEIELQNERSSIPSTPATPSPKPETCQAVENDVAISVLVPPPPPPPLVKTVPTGSESSEKRQQPPQKRKGYYKRKNKNKNKNKEPTASQ